MARKGYPPSVNPGKPVLGKCPEGWKKGKFKDLVKPVYRKAKLEDEETYQLVLAKRSRGGIVEREKLKGKQIKTKTQFFAHAGDFLISRRQIVHGACGIVPQELHGSIVSNEYSTLQPVNGFDLDYLSYFCHTPYFQQTCFHSSVGVDVEKMIFKLDEWLNKPVLIPPHPQQKKIVEILSCWDSAIETIEKLIDAKTRFKKGLLQQVFPSPKDLRANDIESLKLLSKIQTGKKDVNEGNPSGKYPFFTCAAQPTRSDIYSFDTEAILIAGNGNIGTCHHMQGKFEAYQRTYVLTDFHRVEGKYLYHAIRRYLSREVARQTQVTAMPYIKVGLLQDLDIPVFDRKKREQIVSLLDAADLEIELLQRKLLYKQNQKHGLMQQLLSGNIPVKTSESSNQSVKEEYALNA